MDDGAAYERLSWVVKGRQMVPEGVLARFSAACVNGPHADLRMRRLCAAYEWFVYEGLADPQFAQCLAAEETYRERLSELLVAYKLMRFGYELRSAPVGPDLWAQKGDIGFWVEIVSPRPNNIDRAYLAQVGSDVDGMLEVPADQVLRRWTQAIESKAGALIGGRRGGEGYIAKGIVGVDEAYVIAVNGRGLRGAAGIGFNGCSMNPCVVEAVFGVGPMRLEFEPLGGGCLRPGLRRVQRQCLDSLSGAPIPLVTFLDDSYSQVSAVWGLDIDEDEMLLDPAIRSVERNYFASACAFNPHARNPIPVGSLPTFEDWTCRVSDDAYQLTHHNRIPFRPDR